MIYTFYSYKNISLLNNVIMLADSEHNTHTSIGVIQDNESIEVALKRLNVGFGSNYGEL